MKTEGYPHFKLMHFNKKEQNPEDYIFCILTLSYKFRPEHFKFLREFLDFSQGDIAQFLYTSEKAIRKWENSEKNVDITWCTEKEFRLIMFEHYCIKFRYDLVSNHEKYTNKFYKMYKNLQTKRESKENFDSTIYTNEFSLYWLNNS